MDFSVAFHDDALAEWEALDASVRRPLAKRLLNRQKHPRIEGQRLRGRLSTCYKIRDDKTGHRLVYVVDDEVMELRVIAVGKRNDLEVYRIANSRIDSD